MGNAIGIGLGGFGGRSSGGGAVAGGMVIKSNNFDASAGNFPLLGAAVSKGWVYIVGVAGVLDVGGAAVAVVPGTMLIATVDNPGNTWAGGWNYHQ